MRHSFRFLLLTFTLLVTCAYASPAGAGEPPYLLTPMARSLTPAGGRAVAPVPVAKRLEVGVDFTVVDPAGLGPQEVRVTLPDRTITILKQGVERRGSGGGYTWRGTVAGSELSTVVLTVDQQVIFGSIDFEGTSYTLGTENGAYLVTQKDPRRRGPLADDTLLPPPPLTPLAQARVPVVQAPAVAAAPTEDGSRIDLLILYTPALESVYGAGNGVLTKIQHLVDLANTGYTNSGVATRLHLVGALLYDDPAVSEQPGPNTTSAALVHITGSPEVASLRDQHQADLVSLLRAYDETRTPTPGSSPPCGLAYIMNADVLGPAFADSAFSVVEVKDMPPDGGAYCDETTLVHELGHNLGCGHDRNHSYYGADGDLLSFDGAFRYSYGYDVAGLFGTIMSYDGPTITYFSTPLRSYQGQPIGKADLYANGTVQPHSADNARTINSTRVVAANFRVGPPQCAPPAALTVPSTDPDGDYTVSWEPSLTEGVSYLLEEATDSAFSSALRSVYSGPALSVPISGRAVGSTYFYRVKAMREGYADSDWTIASHGCRVKISLAAAVDNSGLAWSTGGGGQWFGQYSVSHYGGDAAQSGVVSDSQTTWLQTTVTGPGTVSFQWRVSSEQGFDSLSFTVDGAESAAAPAISGQVPWTPVTLKVLSPGSHLLTWAYTKDYAFAAGVDAGWVDRVRWFPPCATPAGMSVPPAAPEGAITVSWGPSSTPGVSYTLEQATTSSFTTDLQTVYTGSDQSVTLTGRVPGSSYFYRVKARKPGRVDSPWQSAPTGCAVPGTPAEAPASLTVPVRSATGNFQLSWAPSPTAGTSTYLLEEATDKGFTTGVRTVYSGPGLTAPVTVDPGLPLTYSYRVKALANGHTASPWRNGSRRCAVPGTRTPPPTSLTVPLNGTAGRIPLSWGSSVLAGVTYHLQEAQDSGFSVGVRTVYYGPRQGVVVSGRTPGLTYFYRVKAGKIGYTFSAWLTAANGCTLEGVGFPSPPQSAGLLP